MSHDYAVRRDVVMIFQQMNYTYKLTLSTSIRRNRTRWCEFSSGIEPTLTRRNPNSLHMVYGVLYLPKSLLQLNLLAPFGSTRMTPASLLIQVLKRFQLEVVALMFSMFFI